ncbi:N-acetylneuraminate lyase [Aureibaculum algae]|uniref:N-acetylneuraminate lyase n=1 Tax=Aureibaculum algae TaxID=2584122 RepID=A0A5B7TTT2_9FLAO|nr:dihydrodipicolinate synthase family protein [Aureibaculum algae]QCX38613.1 N-acetylneuraminate lyase [Aureibaculum algae]
MKIKNLIAATYAPMHKDQSLNLQVISSYNAFLKTNKVTGAFVNGSTGDFASLSVEERKQIITEWSKHRSDNFVLINHVGHTSLKVAKDLAAHSADKVDAIATLSPFYFKPPTLESLVYYCAEIAKSAPDLPFYYYHIPVLTGADFKMIDFLPMAIDKIPNFAGLKFTKNDLIDYNYCLNYNNKESNVLFGVDEILLSSLPLGATGWVGSTYNQMAPLYYKIIEAFKAGNMELASELQRKAALFVDILNAKGGFNGVAKGFMKTLGVDCGPSRYPHATLSDADYKIIQKELDAVGYKGLLSKN